MKIVCIAAGILIVAVFFIHEVYRWRRQHFTCSIQQRGVRIGLFAATELCLALLLMQPIFRSSIKLLLWYLGTILFLILVLLILLVWDLLLTRKAFDRKNDKN